MVEIPQVGSPPRPYGSCGANTPYRYMSAYVERRVTAVPYRDNIRSRVKMLSSPSVVKGSHGKAVRKPVIKWADFLLVTIKVYEEHCEG